MTTDLEIGEPTGRRWPRKILGFPLEVLLYLGLIGAAELLTTGPWAQLGLWMHAGVLLALLLRATLSHGPLSELFLALSLAPLIRLLSLTLPPHLGGGLHALPLVGLPLIAATLIGWRLLHYRRQEIGLQPGSPPVQLLIAASGLLIGYLERLIIQPEPFAASLRWADVWWPALSLLLFTGLAEELLFRGVMQRTAVNALGAWRGVALVAVVFGFLHAGWHSWPDMVFVTLAGGYLGWVTFRSGSILGAVLAHTLANIMLFIVLPLLGA